MFQNRPFQASISYKSVASNRKSVYIKSFTIYHILPLGCLGEDEAPQLKDAVCAVLRSADVIALQGADNMRVSCLPCYGEFREKYEWSGYGMPRGFKVMVKVIR